MTAGWLLCSSARTAHKAGVGMMSLLPVSRWNLTVAFCCLHSVSETVICSSRSPPCWRETTAGVGRAPTTWERHTGLPYAPCLSSGVIPDRLICSLGQGFHDCAPCSMLYYAQSTTVYANTCNEQGGSRSRCDSRAIACDRLSRAGGASPHNGQVAGGLWLHLGRGDERNI